MTRIHPRTARALASYMAALPGTKTEVIRRSGLNHSTVSKFTKRMHRAGIRICGWQPHPVRGPEIPIYAVGDAPDAVDGRARLTRKQIHGRYEKRIEGTEAADRRRSKQSSLYFEKRAKRTQQNPFSAPFMGGAHA